MTRETPSLEPQQAGLLHECRDLATLRIRRSMGSMLKDLNEALFDRAFGEGGNVADSPYFDAVREIQFRKQEIALRFEKRLTDLFEEELRNARAARDPEAGHAEQAAPPSDEDAGEVAERVAQDCRQALLVLDKRIGVLMRDPNLSCSRNPLAPARVFEAFRAACDDIDSGEQARRLLLDVFERHMEQELADIYGEINAVLARRGVLPGLSILPEQDSGTVTVQLGPRLTSHQDEEAAADSPGPDLAHVRVRLETQVAGRAVPHFVRAFLFERWLMVLERIAGEKGEDGPEWEKAMETAEELIRSVQEFADGDSRRHAIWTLPSLVHRLRRGMRGISMTLHEQMLFLRTLRAYHLRMIGQKTPAAGLRAIDEDV
jgi:hypothetical protein